MRRYQHDARRTAAVVAGVNLADDAAQEAFARAFDFLHRAAMGQFGIVLRSIADEADVREGK